VWPRVLAHAKKELNANGLGSDSGSMAAASLGADASARFQERVDETTGPHHPIADLQSYLSWPSFTGSTGPYSKNRNMRRGLSLFRPAWILKRIESAQDSDWVEELERAIAIRELLTVWTAGQERFGKRDNTAIRGRDFDLAKHRRAASKNEVSLRIGENSSEYRSTAQGGKAEKGLGKVHEFVFQLKGDKVCKGVRSERERVLGARRKAHPGCAGPWSAQRVPES